MDAERLKKIIERSGVMIEQRRKEELLAAIGEDNLMSGVGSETKTKLVEFNGIISISKYDNGKLIDIIPFLPDIMNVRVLGGDNNVKVVKVSFADGTSEKAVLDKADTFSLEQGISICITKKIINLLTTSKDAGGSIYNKIVHRAISVMNQKRKEEEKAIATAKAQKEKAEKIEAKKKERREKLLNKEREEFIQIQQEAFVRAFKQISEEGKKEAEESIDELVKLFGDIINEITVDDKDEEKEVIEVEVQHEEEE